MLGSNHEIQSDRRSKGTFYHAECYPGTSIFTGTISHYEFTVTEVVNPDKIIVQFGSDFTHYMVCYKRPGSALPIYSNANGFRTLTRRKNGNWVFRGHNKLYAGESIEFDV